MKMSILFRTSAFRGDHAADICLPVEPLEGETVEALLKRVGLSDASGGDCVEIRLIAIEAPPQEPSE
jgi:hypothetical protein